jgi:hypothetical protein
MPENTVATGQIDPVSEANNLANSFYGLSQALDTFRFAARNPPLPAVQAGQLKDESQALDNRAHYFTAQAIGATLQAIQSDLANIKTLTSQAQQQVQSLKDVDRVIKIVTSALSLGAAIAAGNVANIESSVQALAGEV